MKSKSIFIAIVAIATIFFITNAAHANAATACYAAWSSSAIYTAGGQASQNNVNYTANWWTQGNSPSTNSGGSGSGQPWTSDGACSGSGSGGGTGGSGGTPPAAGTAMFAPYIDMSLTADENLTTIQQQSGIKVFTLAFIVDNGSCQAGWGGLGGTIPQDSLPDGTTIQSLVQQVRSNGGDVIVSFGGANGTDISSACTSAGQVQAMYQSVITRYNLTMVDFDIEGGAQANPATISYRNQALAALKAANPNLYISFTLPVLPTGLTQDGVNILNAAKSSGLNPDLINVMAMDYGSAVDNGGQMGTDAVDAATATYQQVQTAGLSSTIGVTPMIGVNDVNPEVFQLADAQTLLNFATANTWIKRLAMWSVARDNGNCAGTAYASPSCSGLSQNDYAFAKAFEPF